MLRDRAAPVDLFALVPALELRFEPELAELDRLLEDDELFEHVKADLSRRWPRTTVTGRPSTPVEVVLRMLVIQHLYAWSYAQAEHFIGDSLVLRQFCRLGFAPMPHHTTLMRWANAVQPETLHVLLDRVTELARSLKVTRGRKLRIDSTVVETTIRHPSDSGLLADGVRVLSRLVRRAGALLAPGQIGAPLFRDRTRSAKRLARRIHTSAAQSSTAGVAERTTLYQQLLRVTQLSLGQAAQVGELLKRRKTDAAKRLRTQLERFQPLVQQVCAQAQRRVLGGEAVSAAEKLVSLFEPHTAVIRRGKLPTPPNSAPRWSWTKWMVAWSRAMRLWRAIHRMRRIYPKVLTITALHSVVYRRCWRAIEAFLRARTNGSLRPTACAALLSHTRVRWP